MSSKDSQRRIHNAGKAIPNGRTLLKSASSRRQLAEARFRELASKRPGKKLKTNKEIESFFKEG